MRRAAAVALGLGLAAAAPAAVRLAPYPDEPPVGMTGGFGEPTCAVCHFPSSAPDSAGSLVVHGIPRSYAPGAEYELSIDLARPDLARAGFALTARFAAGPDSARQAGALAATGADATVTGAAGVLYAHHTAAGARPRPDQRARWSIRWTAPAKSAAPVVFHVVGNAANGDESALGDHVLALEAESRPAEP